LSLDSFKFVDIGSHVGLPYYCTIRHRCS